MAEGRPWNEHRRERLRFTLAGLHPPFPRAAALALARPRWRLD